MKYSELVKIYEQLEGTMSKLEKTDIIANFLGRVPEDLLGIIPTLVMGRAFPAFSSMELGLGPRLLYDAISFVTGIDKPAIERTIGEEGDVGNAVEKLFKAKSQTSLLVEELTVSKAHQNFVKIAEATGKGAQEKKIRLLSELLTNASPKEAKYIVRTVLEELRIGVAEGLVRDAIAKAFGIKPEAVERAYMLTNDFGKVAKTAKKKGEKGLRSLTMAVGIPLKPMLAQLVPSIEKVIEDVGKAAFEIKYDGARVQIHKKGKDIRIFSRRLEDVTTPLPDIVGYAKKAIKVKEAIIEGEIVAIDPETGKPRAFQAILRRFRRKYDITKTVKRIPFDVYIFDILFVDGKAMIDEEFRNRRKKLEDIIKPVENKFMLAQQVITDDVKKAEEFYHLALDMGHEGVMIKNLSAPYIPGARVGYMYKLKPVMETLDLVIVGALWGTGKRAGWLSSYYLGARDEDTGDFVSIGRVGTGVTEEMLDDLTKRLKGYIEHDTGTKVRLKPELVVEVAFQEIQRSPKYPSGYALRFPRVIKIREDKGPEDADVLDRVRKLYEMQYS